MPRRGLLIVSEGADGSGKETQTTLLCEHLEREGHRVTRYNFPTYAEDPVAALIRTLLREQKDEWNTRAWESRALLYASNRAKFRDEMLNSLSEPGRVIICNRYVQSNKAHMAAYVEDPMEWERRIAWIGRLEYELIGMPRPDITFLHTMPRKVSDTLLEKREDGKQDAHEENSAYLERVEKCYHVIADLNPSTWRHIPADQNGEVESPEDVHDRVWQSLMQHPAWQELQEQIAGKVRVH